MNIKTAGVAMLVLGLSACAAVDELSESAKWLFATQYPMTVTGSVPKGKIDLFVNYSREPLFETTSLVAGQEMAYSMFEHSGYRLVFKESSARLLANVKVQAEGPQYESRVITERREKGCDSSGRNCSYEDIKLDRKVSICTYTVDVSLKESNGSAESSVTGLTAKTQWISEKQEGADSRRDFSGFLESLVTEIVTKALVPPRKCNEENGKLKEHLAAVGYVLGLSDTPQGIFELQGVRGDFRINPK